MFDLAKLLFRRFVGDARARPYLTVRVRVARTHHGPTVLEDLNIVDGREPTELLVLRGPQVHDEANFCSRHAREGQVMAWRKTGHAAGTGLTLRHQQTSLIQASRRSVKKY